MKRVASGSLFFVCILLCFFIPSALAHDGDIGSESNPIEIDWIGPVSEVNEIHNDEDPYKGWLTLWVKNICGPDEDWGDFHLKLKGLGSYFVDFVVDANHMPEIEVFNYSTGWRDITDIDWELLDSDSQLNLEFYDEPIFVDEMAKIKVYTDNTHFCNPFFYVKAYPTAVPEPATLVLLGLGGLVLFRKRR